jgi:hypothetical protein
MEGNKNFTYLDLEIGSEQSQTLLGSCSFSKMITNTKRRHKIVLALKPGA